jgi:hypothetical protein
VQKSRFKHLRKKREHQKLIILHTKIDERNSYSYPKMWFTASIQLLINELILLENVLFQIYRNFIPKDSSDNARKVLYEIWNMLQGEIFK